MTNGSPKSGKSREPAKPQSELERRTAAYPDEIADRLIKMFSVKGDTVLDPFLGSGTTTKAAMQNERNSIGYETDPNLLQVIKKKIDCYSTNMAVDVKVVRNKKIRTGIVATKNGKSVTRAQK